MDGGKYPVTVPKRARAKRESPRNDISLKIARSFHSQCFILLCIYTHQGCTMVTVLDPAGVLPTAVQGGRINERPGIQLVVHSLGANLPSTVDGRPLGIAESGTGLPIFQHWTKSWRCCSLLGVVAA